MALMVRAIELDAQPLYWRPPKFAALSKPLQPPRVHHAVAFQRNAHATVLW